MYACINYTMLDCNWNTDIVMCINDSGRYMVIVLAIALDLSFVHCKGLLDTQQHSFWTCVGGLSIGRTDREQIRSRINNNWCRTFQLRGPLSTIRTKHVAETSCISCYWFCYVAICSQSIQPDINNVRSNEPLHHGLSMLLDDRWCWTWSSSYILKPMTEAEWPISWWIAGRNN